MQKTGNIADFGLLTLERVLTVWRNIKKKKS